MEPGNWGVGLGELLNAVRNLSAFTELGIATGAFLTITIYTLTVGRLNRRRAAHLVPPALSGRMGVN